MNIGKKDVFWGYVSIGMVQGINIILLPIILKYLSATELGLWYTFTSLYGLAMLIDFGFQTIISRNISYLWAGANSIEVDGFNQEKNTDKVNIPYFVKVLSTVKFLYFSMGTIVFVFLITLGTGYIWKISNGEIEIKIALIAYILYMFSIVLNITFSYWNSVLKGIGAIKLYNQILIITKVVQLVLSIVFLMLGYGLIGVSLAYLLSVIINRILQSYAYYKFSDETKRTRRKIFIKYDKAIFHAILPNTIKTGVLSLANYLIINFPIILCSYYLSLEISGRFGLLNQILTLILTLSNSYFNTYLSKFNFLRVKGEYDELFNLFRKSIVTNYLFNIISFVFLIILGNWFLMIIGTDYKLIGINTMLITIVYRFLYNNQVIFTSFLSTKNKVPHYKHFIISAIITILLQFILLQFWESNLYTLLLPLLLVQLLFNNWYWVMYVMKDIRSDKNGKFIVNE
ncbi:O-unit flippase-like protein [Mammaliicoccus sp. P-M55]|uniref:O-unit flippase-like protein n=1 Tax=Mammaliicoccus sp. P-M55 TaxID=2898714 RepID=UPI001EFBB50F|nr:O-unit flippase-like protein [Mammaliicoccus sp. P-M55]